MKGQWLYHLHSALQLFLQSNGARVGLLLILTLTQFLRSLYVLSLPNLRLTLIALPCLLEELGCGLRVQLNLLLA